MATRCKIVRREQKPHVTQFPPQNACVISLGEKKKKHVLGLTTTVLYQPQKLWIANSHFKLNRYIQRAYSRFPHWKDKSYKNKWWFIICLMMNQHLCLKWKTVINKLVDIAKNVLRRRHVVCVMYNCYKN